MLIGPLWGEFGWEVPSPDAPVAVMFRAGRGEVWDLGGRAARLRSTFQWSPPRPPKVSASGNATLVLPNRQGNRVAIVPTESDVLTVARIEPFRPLWSRTVHAAYGLPLDWSPDGKVLMVEEVGRTRLLSREGRELGTLPLSKPFAFVGRLVYGLGRSGVEAYDLATRRRRRRFPDPGSAAPLGISPDGRWLVAGSHRRDKYVYRVWRVRDGRPVGECPGAGFLVNDGFDPTFLPGSRFRLDGIREVHALPSGRLLARLPGWTPLDLSEGNWIRSRRPAKRP